MEHEIKENGSDALLVPFLDATSESISDESLSVIINELAEPIITKILKSKLRVSLNGRGTQQNQDALEIAGDLRTSIISALRALKQNPTHKPIVSFPDFVAIKAYSACADYFREKHPQRWRLKNLLRRHLRQNPRFALWQAEDRRWYAGFSEQQEVGVNIEGRAGAHSPSYSTTKILDGRVMQPGELLAALFERSSGPMDFNNVVTIAAETWDIYDPAVESIDVGSAANGSAFTSPEPKIDWSLEQRLFLKQVWSEVCQLPVLQRAALLLNLRDSSDGGVISFLPFLGITTKEEIARLLEMSDEAFQGLWQKLPLDDLAIAQFFGITRQQVINLRKTARERLVRRVRKLETGQKSLSMVVRKTRQ